MNLIHIGLPKNGSTSLQAGWSNTKDINYVSNDLSSLVAATRKSAINGTDPNDLLSLWPDSYNKSINIYSSEGLAGLAWGYNASLDKYDYSQYLFANICKEFISDAKILILVRSPLAWIKSVYAQTIQEGSNLGFSRFLRQQRNYLVSGLNITALSKHWSEVYGTENIVIYPFERLIEAPILANKELSHLFDVPVSMQLFTVKAKSNRSLSESNIQLLRAMSILHKRFLGKDNELKSSFRKLNEDMRLLYRVQLQKRDISLAYLSDIISPILYRLPKSEHDIFKSALYKGFLYSLICSGNFSSLIETYKRDIDIFLNSS